MDELLAISDLTYEAFNVGVQMLGETVLDVAIGEEVEASMTEAVYSVRVVETSEERRPSILNDPVSAVDSLDAGRLALSLDFEKSDVVVSGLEAGSGVVPKVDSGD